MIAEVEQTRALVKDNPCGEAVVSCDLLSKLAAEVERLDKICTTLSHLAMSDHDARMKRLDNLIKMEARAEDAERELSKAAQKIVELEASQAALERELAEARLAITTRAGKLSETQAAYLRLQNEHAGEPL